jgi:hypothetical protein
MTSGRELFCDNPWFSAFAAKRLEAIQIAGPKTKRDKPELWQ